MRTLLVVLLAAPALGLAQIGTPIPKSYESREVLKPAERPSFLKKFTVESFGFSSQPTGAGYESLTRLSGMENLTGHGAECPRCMVRPVMERTRYSLPSFGGQVVWRPFGERLEISAGQSGVNAWKPDHSVITHERSTSFNNDWQLEHWFGAEAAVDPGRHFWLGGVIRSVHSFGPSQRNWVTKAGTATFRFGK